MVALAYWSIGADYGKKKTDLIIVVKHFLLLPLEDLEKILEILGNTLSSKWGNPS